jgi:motility quorum-sensing regulator/GCU-specific mRNA interferase toxin
MAAAGHRGVSLESRPRYRNGNFAPVLLTYLPNLTYSVKLRAMEKRVPHCKLSMVTELVRAGRVSTTRSAREGAAALGLDYDGMLGILMGLTAADFYKSMTTHEDHRVWQDVYRPSTVVGYVYLKLTAIDDVLIVSFKEL